MTIVQMQEKRGCSGMDSSMSLRRVVGITRRCKNCGLPIALRFWLAECTSKMIPSFIKCLFYNPTLCCVPSVYPFWVCQHFMCENEQQSQARIARLLALSTGGILGPSPNSLKEQQGWSSGSMIKRFV